MDFKFKAYYENIRLGANGPIGFLRFKSDLIPLVARLASALYIPGQVHFDDCVRTGKYGSHEFESRDIVKVNINFHALGLLERQLLNELYPKKYNFTLKKKL